MNGNNQQNKKNYSFGTGQALIDIIDSDIRVSDNDIKPPVIIEEKGDPDVYDFEFFHIREITYEEDAPRREALENVLGSLRLDGVNFVYLIVGKNDGISFYLGVVKNKIQIEIDIDDIARQILKSNIEGNFRGSRVAGLTSGEKKSLKQRISRFRYAVEVDGVPNVNEEAEQFQGIDRLVDIMLGDEFALMIISSAISLDKIIETEKELYRIYDKLSPFVRKTLQKVNSSTKTKSDIKSSSTAQSDSKTKSNSSSTSISNSTVETTSQSNSTNNTGAGKTSSKSSGEQESKTTQTTDTDSSGVSTTKSDSESTTTTLSDTENRTENETLNMEFAKKYLEEWLKYIDDVLLKRIDYAKGKGGFKSGIYLFADTRGKIKKLGNTFVSLFNGISQNKMPLRYNYIDNKLYRKSICSFQLPCYHFDCEANQKQKMILYSKIDGINWFSTRELSIVASLPQKEVVGLKLKEEVEFGLNIPDGNGIKLGKLIRNGQRLDIDVNLDRNELNKHIFVTGVTGSGKTTTCYRILNDSGLPFLVIEPAKTEYRMLAKRDDDVLVFTLGNEKIAPFRLNPFEFFEGENISSRVDMIKAAIESAFDMEAAIPQIIEDAIYRSYERYGWDIAMSENREIENPFHKSACSFPLLEDVIMEVEKVVESHHFSERLESDYIASIRARFQGLMVGSKKFMLNTPRSFDFRNLLNKKVVIELEEIKNPGEKSFIMGLLLINLNEAIKSVYRKERKKGRKFRHITLVEEAHRLLSRFEPGDSLNKKRGVEAFTDMLAEVRKYGESLIIVDQIPASLTPEVLKNTNTKIVHRIFAADDKEMIGNTMALHKEQKEFLSQLDVGRAVVFNQKFYNAVQVSITPPDISTDSPEDVDEKILKNRWIFYYSEEKNLDGWDKRDVQALIRLEKLWMTLINRVESGKIDDITKGHIRQVRHLLQGLSANLNDIIEFIDQRFYNSRKRKKDLLDIMQAIVNDEEMLLKLKKIKRR